jgi:hypothetical protein
MNQCSSILQKRTTRALYHKNVLDNLNIWKHLKCFAVIDRHDEKFLASYKKHTHIIVLAQFECSLNHAVYDTHNT